MIRNREDAARHAERSTANTPAMCQSWTRNQFNALSVGDVDRDRDADAVDGWKSEPPKWRHTDRHPPRGVPVAWSGGSNGHGHRAVSLGHGKIRSTDAGGRGIVATVDLDWPERQWGMRYLGWSESISGVKIPKPRLSRGQRIDRALKILLAARRGTDSTGRRSIITKARNTLKRIRRRPVP